MDEDLRDIVLAATEERDGKRILRCARAFELAAERGVDLLDVARVCNREGVKIAQCQLGCFK